MRYLFLLFFAAVCLAVPCAQGSTCFAGPTAFTAADISAGAATSTALNTDTSDEVILEIDLVDANATISNLRITWTIGTTSGGQFRAFPDCDVTSPVFTCKTKAIDWNPQTDGLSWVLPLRFSYAFVKITATPTGNDAGDTITLTTRRCKG